MPIGNTDHSGFISYVHKDTLVPYAVTTVDNEIIEFKKGEIPVTLNSLVIESVDSELYIRPIPFDYCLYLNIGESKNCDYISVSSIQIMGNAGTKYRWFGMIA